MNHFDRGNARRPNGRERAVTLLLRISVSLAGIIFLTDLSSVAVAAPQVESEAQPVSYALDLRSPNIHLVGVSMTIPGAKPGTQIQFPAWNALYQIRDFVRNIIDLKASCDGTRIELSRLDLNTWTNGKENCRSLDVSYSVYLVEDSVFSSDFDSGHAFLNLAMVLFYLPQERHRPVRIQYYNLPWWKLATLLAGPDEKGWYAARTYDELVDSPVEAGVFQEYRYEQNGAEYRIVVHADVNRYDSKRLVESVKRITAAGTGMMRNVLFPRYTFIYHFPPEGLGGGMEHRDGAAIAVAGSNLGANWSNFESMTAHEFLHAWNVKRLRPQNLEPVDYIQGNDTSDLWFAEGVTNTLAEYLLLRAGMTSSNTLYARFGAEINRLHERTARRLQSVEGAGREAWLEKYPDYLRPERSISYYNKGAILGFLLDLAIRHATENRRSLDDFFQRLNENFSKQGKFFTREDLIHTLYEVAPEGCDFRQFFRDFVSGTEELDLDTSLGYAGLKLVVESGRRPSLGFATVQNFDGPVFVQSVETDSAAGRAGLEAGDVLLGVDGKPALSPLDGLRDGLTPGREVRLRVLRGSREQEIRFRVDSMVGTTYRIEEAKNPTEAQRLLRQHWLSGTTLPAAGE